MALKVADLYFEMEVRGDVQRDLDRARDAAQDLVEAGSEAHKRLQQIAMPASLRQDTQRVREQLGRVESQARETGQRTRDIELNRQLDNQTRRAEQGVSKISEAASKAGEKLSNMGQGLGERLSSQGSGAGAGFGGAFLAGAGPKLASLGSKAGPIGMAVTGVLAIGVGAGALLADAIADGMEMEKARDKIQAELGTTPEMMKTIAKASADAYVNVFGESVQSNMEAAKYAIQGGLLTGEETANDMQPVIQNLTMVSDLLGEEIPRVSRAASQFIKTGLVQDTNEAFDLLVKANQKGLNVSEDLLDSVIEYGTKFRDLGLSGEEAFALMNQAVKNGARDSDVAADALKEFSIRVREDSESTREAYKALGLDADDMLKKMNSGGDVARAELNGLFDAINKIEDPVKRNAVAIGLFGTQAEDLGDALKAMDLDTAAQEFGVVAGAASEAARVMGDNAATKLEGAKRQIEVSMNGVKESMAQAFGPTLEQIATWISTHKPEIIGFFVQLTDTVLATGEGFLSFTSGTLRLLANLGEGVATFVGGALSRLGGLSSGIGSVIKHIPGMQGVGESLQDAGKFMQDWDDKARDQSNTLRGWADALDKGRDKLGQTRDQLRQTGAEAVASAELTRALGDTVVSLPDGKDIFISDNTPEVEKKLNDLGLHIERTPDGQFKIVAHTDEGQNKIDSFVAANNGKNINMLVSLEPDYSKMSGTGTTGTPRASVGNHYPQRNANGSITQFASGGVVGNAPDQAVISSQVPGGINQWAEAGPEAYVPLSPEKKERSTKILALAAGRFGLMLVQPEQFANGGIVESLIGLGSQKAPGLQVTDSYRPGASDWHGAGQAVDFSNGYGNTDEMLAWANYLADNHREQLNELIYDDPRFNKNIKNGQFVSRNFYAGAGDHTNHVHVAANQPLTAKEGDGKPTDNLSPKQKRAKAIYDEGRRRGMSDKAIKIALATALTESGDDLKMWANMADPESLNFEHDAIGSDGSSSGLFQQQNNGAWGTTADRMDPTKSAGMFYDALSKIDYENMEMANAAQAVQRSAFADGSNYRAKLGAADALFNEVAGLGGGSSSSGGGSFGGGIQDVRVTNWPQGMGMSAVPAAPAAPEAPVPAPSSPADAPADPLRAIQSIATGQFDSNVRRTFGLEESGEFNPGQGQYNPADKFPIMAAGGEVVIPKELAERYGPIISAMFGGGIPGMVNGGVVGGGGFGGYSTAGAKKSMKSGLGFGELLAFGVGLGFAGASGFDAEGRFRGFSTGTTEIAALEQRLDQMWEKREEIKQVVIEQMMINSDDPKKLAEGLFDIATTDPALLKSMERGM